MPSALSLQPDADIARTLISSRAAFGSSEDVSLLAAGLQAEAFKEC